MHARDLLAVTGSPPTFGAPRFELIAQSFRASVLTDNTGYRVGESVAITGAGRAAGGVLPKRSRSNSWIAEARETRGWRRAYPTTTLEDNRRSL